MSELLFAPLTPKTVLGIAAHPDDLDFYAGGSMAAFAQQGADVYYLILTDGGKGNKDRTMDPMSLRDKRREEQRAAGKTLGLKDIFFLDYPDGALENTMDVKRDVVRFIRQVKPDVMVTMDPSVLYSARQGMVNHPDHRAAGQAALDAVYPLARDHMTFPELLEAGYEPHITQTLLLIDFNADVFDFAVDITNTIEDKLLALEKHASQDTLQSLKEKMRLEAAKTGQACGYDYAESFTRIDLGF